MFSFPASILLEVLIIVTSEVWKSVGWGTNIDLTAITGIEPELYEFADVFEAYVYSQGYLELLEFAGRSWLAAGKTHIDNFPYFPVQLIQFLILL